MNVNEQSPQIISRAGHNFGVRNIKRPVSRGARREAGETRARAREMEDKVGIKILIGTSICIIGAGLDETSPVPTVAHS